MKQVKRILILAALAISSSGFSQDAPARRMKTLSLGPSIGFGHTGIRNTVGSDIFKPAWSAGLIINYSSQRHFGFAADVLWSLEGARVESGGAEIDLTLQYIRIPLKAVYYFGEFEDDFRPKITLGPSMGFLIDGVRDSDAPNDPATNVTSFYEKFDIGANASIGFNWKIAANMWLNTDFNYYTGFIKIRSNQYNSNFGIKLGVAFGL